MIRAFLMAGQSNMSGRGPQEDMPALVSEHVLMLRESAWQTAVEPLRHDSMDNYSGMGPAFGTAVHAMTGDDIGLIPCSKGGSALAEWHSGEPLFENAVQQCCAAMDTGARIEGILWHQGETDAEQLELALTYHRRFVPMLKALMARLREHAAELGDPGLVAPELPVIVGELGDFLDDTEKWRYHRIVNEQLHEFAARRPEYACVAMRELAHKGDSLHFSTQSLRVMGVRYAAAWAGAALRVGII